MSLQVTIAVAMSTYEHVEIACPACGRGGNHQIAISVNAVRKKTLRQEILDGAFQKCVCEHCNAVFHHETTFTYLDLDRHQLILTLPPDEQPRWTDAEAAVRGLAERVLTGPDVPDAARALADGLQLRVCFGLSAFAEKVRCAMLGVDDVTLEILKLVMMLRDPRLGLAPLRLAGGDDKLLTLLGNAGPIEIDRAALAAIDDEAHAPARQALSAGPYVDLARLV